MKRYIEQLIEDLHQATWKVRPPHVLWEESGADPDDELELEDMSYVEKTMYGEVEPISEITGIDNERLPPVEKLTQLEQSILATELENLLQYFHFHLDFPANYPEHLRYPFILKIWAEEHVALSFGNNHIEFCDMDEESCPFPGYCNTCKEVAEQMKFDEEQCSKVDFNFDIDVKNLLPSPEEIENFMKQPFNQNNMQLFTNLYETLSEKDKSDYLFNLLESNSILKSDFIRYFESRYEQLRLETVVPFSFDDQLAIITEKADYVAETLEELDFEEPDWDRWQGSSHYVPDYEVAQIVAEDEASDVFGEFIFELKTVLQTENLTDIISDFTAVFHGVTCADINDPENNLGDPANDYFIDELKKLVKQSHESLAMRVFGEIDYENALELAFRFDELHYDDEKDYLQFISGLLFATVKNKELAQIVWAAKAKFNGRLNLVPELLNKVTKMIGDKKIWVESMESCFLQNLDSSIDLMDHYYAGNSDEFEKAAPRLWQTFSSNVLDYLLDKVRKGTPFHITLLKKNASRKGESASLELLKQYISPKETEEFIDSMDNNNTKAFFYAHEKFFDKLIAMVNANCLKYATYSMIDFTQVMPWLFNDRPGEAWEMIKKMITMKMDSSQRTRDTYAYIANLLLIAKKINGIDQEIRTVTSNLYNNKPNLPALKDEFRKAGIV